MAVTSRKLVHSVTRTRYLAGLLQSAAARSSRSAISTYFAAISRIVCLASSSLNVSALIRTSSAWSR
jgi:hypothetical protein